MATRVKVRKSNEIYKSKDEPMFENCPYCGGGLECTWQQTQNYDDSNPVRICHKCDTAWIWQVY